MRLRWRLLAGPVILIAAAVLADRLFPPDLSRYHEVSHRILDRAGTPLQTFLTKDGFYRLPIDARDVDPAYLRLLVATEDKRFYRHSGVDPLALMRASWQLISRGHIVSGGSTLTMQTARLLEPHRHTVLGKLWDIARAVQLEAHFSKADILSMYLTLAPMGGNLEGVRAGSRAYFGHSAAHLAPDEAALLVALPRHPARVSRRLTRQAWPRLAPHLAEHLRETDPSLEIRTTIDAALQRAAVALLDRERPWAMPDVDYALLIVENRTGAIRAWVGGNLAPGRPGAAVDMIRVARSPGSALKPFIYGLALEDGTIRAGTLIDDQPVMLAGYAPRNYDRLFHGTVTASVALQQSYNIPAVSLLARVGAARFAATLAQAGAHLTFPHKAWSPSLALALGGAGISLRDLARLYTSLGDHGQAAALRVLATDPDGRAALLSPDAAGKITAILRDAPLPTGVAPRARPIAWKTGTSYGGRDTVAVGVSPRWTVAVWSGRADGTAIPGALARAAAAPVLFAAFDLLPPEPGVPAPRRGAGTIRRLGADMPEIVYPPPRSRLDLARLDGRLTPLALEAAGGTPPYRWAVNGAPLPPSPAGSPPSWQPDGPGFVHLSVTDSAEQTSSTQVRIE